MAFHRFLIASVIMVTSLPAAAAQSGATAQIPSPTFPSRDLEEGHYGTVQIELEIDAAGKLATATVVKGSGCNGLDQSALDAARRGTYKPATDAGGGPVASTLLVSINFDPPYGTPAENEAHLKRMLNLPCAQYLERLAVDPDEGRNEGFAWTFGMPLLQFEQLYASQGRKVELLPQRTKIYRKVVKYCSAAPDTPAYEVYARAVREVQP